MQIGAKEFFVLIAKVPRDRKSLIMIPRPVARSKSAEMREIINSNPESLVFSLLNTSITMLAVSLCTCLAFAPARGCFHVILAQYLALKLCLSGWAWEVAMKRIVSGPNGPKRESDLKQSSSGLYGAHHNEINLTLACRITT